MKLYVCSISTFVVLGLLGSLSKATALSPSRFSLASTSVAVAAASTASSTKNHQYKSFHEWKTGMISSADSRTKQAQEAINQKQRTSASADPNAALKSGSSEAGISTQLQVMQSQLEKEQYQLSIAKDLTISDYFVGYLTKQKDMPAAISEVSGRLTPEEVAELMSAYATNFFTSTRSTSAGSAPVRSGSN